MNPQNSDEKLTSIPTGTQRYQRGRMIKDSLFGKVRLGWDDVKEEYVIIKECVIERVKSRKTEDGLNVAEDIEMEIELHQKLSEDRVPCDSIIEFREKCQDGKNIYIVIEHASGGDLFGHVTTNTIKLMGMWHSAISHQVKQQKLKKWQNQVRNWIRKILEALKFMHDRNICHRDISLENFVLCKGMNVKVIDFGLAHEYKDGNFRTECGVLGKIKYLSPECAANQYYDGRHNDMWALGVSLWMCLVGSPPWDSASFYDKRYCFIMRGVSGIKGLLTRWQRSFMCPDSAVDLLSKIFRPEKDRITVDEALKHPFITGYEFSLLSDQLYVPAPIGNWKPHEALCLEWESRRGEEKLEPPTVWCDMSLEIKEKIQSFLLTVNKHTGSIFDCRVPASMERRFNIKSEDAQEILIYFMAASRNRVRLPESIQRRKPLPLLQFNVSERKAQDQHEEARLASKAVPDSEEKHELVLRASFKRDEHNAEVSYPLEVKVGATLSQIKFDFALLQTKKLNTPFIAPVELEILVDGESLEDPSMLRKGSVISGRNHGECEGSQWFSELPQIERDMFLNNNPDENSQRKFFEMLETKFHLDQAKCSEIWKYFTQNVEHGEDFQNQNVPSENAADYDWLKVLYTDAKGKYFALQLSAIVVSNIEDKRASIVLLQQKGLNREKALQAMKYFSGKFGEK